MINWGMIILWFPSHLFFINIYRFLHKRPPYNNLLQNKGVIYVTSSKFHRMVFLTRLTPEALSQQFTKGWASVLHGQWQGTTFRHCGLSWVCLYWNVPCYPCKILLELFILLPVAMDVCLHGGVRGKDREKVSFRGAEEPWEAHEQASLSQGKLYCD